MNSVRTCLEYKSRDMRFVDDTNLKKHQKRNEVFRRKIVQFLNSCLTDAHTSLLQINTHCQVTRTRVSILKNGPESLRNNSWFESRRLISFRLALLSSKVLNFLTVDVSINFTSFCPDEL